MSQPQTVRIPSVTINTTVVYRDANATDRSAQVIAIRPNGTVDLAYRDDQHDRQIVTGRPHGYEEGCWYPVGEWRQR